MQEAASMIDSIETKDDFIIFLQKFKEALVEHKPEWINRDVQDYIEAMSYFLMDSTERSLHKMDLTPSWKTFARIMITAVVYE